MPVGTNIIYHASRESTDLLRYPEADPQAHYTLLSQIKNNRTVTTAVPLRGREDQGY